MMKRLYLLSVFCILTITMYGQHGTGLNGLIHVPTADMDTVGLARLGAQFLPKDMVTMVDDIEESFETEKIVREMRKKSPILITTDSVADIPEELLAKTNIPMISCIL